MPANFCILRLVFDAMTNRTRQSHPFNRLSPIFPRIWAIGLAIWIAQLSALVAQVLPFERVPDLRVWRDDTTLLRYAWAGGLNNPQFSAIDWNNDGLSDLAIFDRSNNTMLSFVCHTDSLLPAVPQTPYRYAPEYAAYMPPILRDWVLLSDYTADGLPDIFTYSNAGIAVYRAQRNADQSISFTLAASPLRYLGLVGVPLNIPSSSIEIPALYDINGDGDLDILHFNSSGTKVEYFENQSIELTGNPADTLWFLRYDRCWGDFTENPFSNEIELFADCNDGMQQPDNSRQLLHSGSSLLAFDADKDDDTDLLVGDVLGRHLVLLRNAAAPPNALMTEQDTLFPSESGVPLDLYLFPAAFYLDTNADQNADIIVAPNAEPAQSTHSVWRYLGTSDTTALEWTFDTDCFLLCDMIDVGMRSYPAFADYNQDGKLDLLIGNRGYFDTATQTYRAQLMLFENIGLPGYPEFRLVSDDFAAMSAYNLDGLYPAFADLDNDGDIDLLAGSENGSVHFFRNTALPDMPMQLELETFNLLEIAGGDSAVPCLYDIDQDGRPDLILGEKAGKLNLWRNISIGGNPQFELISSFWGQVDVRTTGNLFGYSAPFIATLPDTEQPYLLVSSESGRVFVYTDLTQTAFTPQPDIATLLNEGGRGGLAVADLNQNGTLEMAVGNMRGGLGLWSQAPGVQLSVNPDIAPLTDESMPIKLRYNAATRELIINSTYAGAAALQLYDILGRCAPQTKDILSPESAYNWQLPAALPMGCYVLRITGKEKGAIPTSTVLVIVGSGIGQ